MLAFTLKLLLCLLFSFNWANILKYLFSEAVVAGALIVRAFVVTEGLLQIGGPAPVVATFEVLLWAACICAFICDLK